MKVFLVKSAEKYEPPVTYGVFLDYDKAFRYSAEIGGLTTVEMEYTKDEEVVSTEPILSRWRFSLVKNNFHVKGTVFEGYTLRPCCSLAEDYRLRSPYYILTCTMPKEISAFEAEKAISRAFQSFHDDYPTVDLPHPSGYFLDLTPFLKQYMP